MTLRIILLALAVLGGALLATESPPRIDVLPLPAAALKVRIPLEVRTQGEYDLLVSMAKVGTELGLTSETVPCDLSLEVEKGGKLVVTRAIRSITRQSEIGYKNTQQYGAKQPFHLATGTYDVSITGGANCASATSRGASVTVERREREHILGFLLRYLAARVFLAVGLLGLTILAFRRAPLSRE